VRIAGVADAGVREANGLVRHASEVALGASNAAFARVALGALAAGVTGEAALTVAEEDRVAGFVPAFEAFPTQAAACVTGICRVSRIDRSIGAPTVVTTVVSRVTAGIDGGVGGHPRIRVRGGRRVLCARCEGEERNAKQETGGCHQGLQGSGVEATWRAQQGLPMGKRLVRHRQFVGSDMGSDGSLTEFIG